MLNTRPPHNGKIYFPLYYTFHDRLLIMRFNMEDWEVCIILLYYTALHNTALHYTALHYTALQYNTLHCTALYCSALYCTALYCTALYTVYG